MKVPGFDSLNSKGLREDLQLGDLDANTAAGAAPLSTAKARNKGRQRKDALTSSSRASIALCTPSYRQRTVGALSRSPV